jgi:methyl-accepting chemotaxis protein
MGAKSMGEKEKQQLKTLAVTIAKFAAETESALSEITATLERLTDRVAGLQKREAKAADVILAMSSVGRKSAETIAATARRLEAVEERVDRGF